MSAGSSPETLGRKAHICAPRCHATPKITNLDLRGRQDNSIGVCLDQPHIRASSTFSLFSLPHSPRAVQCPRRSARCSTSMLFTHANAHTHAHAVQTPQTKANESTRHLVTHLKVSQSSTCKHSTPIHSLLSTHAYSQLSCTNKSATLLLATRLRIIVR